MHAQRLHCLVAEPGAQAFAQLLPVHRLLRPGIEQVTRHRHERRQFFGQQRHAAGTGRQLQMVQPAARQVEQHRRLALGGEQTHHQLAVGMTLVLEAQYEALHATVAAAQEGGKIGGQPSQREQQRGAGFDLVLELDACGEAVWRLEAGQRRGFPAAYRIQVRQHFRWETSRQTLAGQCEHRAQGAQA